MDTDVISINAPIYEFYLPLVIKATQPPLSPGISPLGGDVFIGLIIVGMVGYWKKRIYR